MAPSKAPKTRGGDLAAELAAELVEGLRDRIERCFAEAAGDEEELAERLRACYREWKGQRVDELASRSVLTACNRGLLDSLAEGTLVHWVVDDGDTPSPDCDDNALADGVRKGDKFPTGHVVPPISHHLPLHRPACALSASHLALDVLSATVGFATNTAGRASHGDGCLLGCRPCEPKPTCRAGADGPAAEVASSSSSPRWCCSSCSRRCAGWPASTPTTSGSTTSG